MEAATPSGLLPSRSVGPEPGRMTATAVGASGVSRVPCRGAGSACRAISVETGYLDYSSTVNYTMTNFSYSSVSVPAPGAAALIGLAGIVAGRRRR